MEQIFEIQEIIDKNKTNFIENDYIVLCKKIKEIYSTIKINNSDYDSDYDDDIFEEELTSEQLFFEEFECNCSENELCTGYKKNFCSNYNDIIEYSQIINFYLYPEREITFIFNLEIKDILDREKSREILNKLLTLINIVKRKEKIIIFFTMLEIAFKSDKILNACDFRLRNILINKISTSMENPNEEIKQFEDKLGHSNLLNKIKEELEKE